MTSPADTGTAYQSALAAAAAAIAAQQAVTPMQQAVSVAATAGEGVIGVRDRAADYAKAVLLALWAPVNPYDRKQVKDFAAAAVKTLTAAQTAVGRAAYASITAQLDALGIKVGGAATIPIDLRAPAVTVRAGKATLARGDSTVRYADGDSVTVTAQDMTTEAVLQRPAPGFRWIQAEEGVDAAEQSGLRIERIVDDQLMLAQRLGETQALAAAIDLDTKKPHRTGAKVIGYRRIVHPELSRGGVCGMCIAAADRVYKVEKLRPIHANCKCTVAPVTTEHDPGDELNKADLQKLYDEAGGTSAAHLKRTRYQVDDHGELGAVLVPKKLYRPRDKTKRAAAANNARAVSQSKESSAEVAARHLPQLEKSLADLRARGVAEDSNPVAWHKEQIEKFHADLADSESATPPLSDRSSDPVRVVEDTKTPEPAAGGSGGGDDGGNGNNGGNRSMDDWEDDRIPPDLRRHILDGDAKGGGHRHDSTRPNKTLYPATWDDAKAISAVSATLDNAYTTSDDHDHLRDPTFLNLYCMVDGVRMVVRIVKSTGRIDTAHPLDGPGVFRTDKNNGSRKKAVPFGQVRNVPLPHESD